MTDIINALIQAQAGQLPGLDSQLKMAPKFGKISDRKIIIEPDTRESAVLVIILPDWNGEASVLLTLRSKTLNNHSGQISFPGGRTEPGETPEETALREANEEIGLLPESVHLIGRLTDLYVYVSKSAITPVLAYLDKIPDFKPNDAEVEEIMLIPLKNLMSPENFIVEKWNLHGNDLDVPIWKIHPTAPLWGATAMILSELTEILTKAGIIL